MTVASVSAERISGISSMAMRHILAELARAYESLSGCCVVVEAVGGVDAARRVADGEAFDFVVLAADAIDRLAASGRVDGASRTDLARSGIAIGVAAGTAHPAIDDEPAVRAAIVRAQSVGYSTGPSGDHLLRLLERWGIAADVGPRLVRARPGLPVATLLAERDVELGFQQLSELMGVPGVDVVGPLPAAIQHATVFAAAACTPARQGPAVRALLAFLASPRADEAKRRHGMDAA